MAGVLAPLGMRQCCALQCVELGVGVTSSRISKQCWYAHWAPCMCSCTISCPYDLHSGSVDRQYGQCRQAMKYSLRSPGGMHGPLSECADYISVVLAGAEFP